MTYYPWAGAVSINVHPVDVRNPYSLFCLLGWGKTSRRFLHVTVTVQVRGEQPITYEYTLDGVMVGTEMLRPTVRYVQPLDAEALRFVLRRLERLFSSGSKYQPFDLIRAYFGFGTVGLTCASFAQYIAMGEGYGSYIGTIQLCELLDAQGWSKWTHLSHLPKYVTQMPLI